MATAAVVVRLRSSVANAPNERKQVMKLVGFTGPMGSGKDTAYQFLAEYLESKGKNALRRGFADALKLSAYRCFNPDASLEESLEWADMIKRGGRITWEAEGSSNGIPGRQFLQYYGTEAHRDVFGSNFWVDTLLPVDGFKKIDQITMDYIPDIRKTDDPDVHGAWTTNFKGKDIGWADVAVITDARFPNEAERIRELGGTIVRIERPAVEREIIHASEQKLEGDFSIWNTGTLDDFRSNVIGFVDSTRLIDE